MPSQSQTPPEVFVSYSSKDKRFKDELLKQLKVLAQQDIISTWHDGLLVPGQQWNAEIVEHLNSSQVILLLISPDFLTSDYVNKVELKLAAERHKKREACVIPVLVRNVNAWKSQPFGDLKLGDLQAVPAAERFIVEWPNRNKAFADVAQGIQEVIATLNENNTNLTLESPIPRPPIVGFVPRGDAEGRNIVEQLKDELAPQKPQLVVLWGAGGVGKTTLAGEAARALAANFSQRVVWVSADLRTDLPFTTFLDEIATQLGNEDLRKLAREQKSEAVRTVVATAPTLIVLDNFETISADERFQCLDFLRRVPCSALITTRQRLEHTRSVPITGMSLNEAERFLGLLIEQTQDPTIFAPPYRQRLIETAEANPLIMEWIVGQIDLANDPEEVLNDLTHGEGDAAHRVFDRSYNLPQLNEGGRAVLLALSLFTPSAGRPTLAAVAGMDLGKAKDKKRFKRAQEALASLWLIKKMEGGLRLAVSGLTRELTTAHLVADIRARIFQRRFVAHFLQYTGLRSKSPTSHHDSLEFEKDNLIGAVYLASTLGDWSSLTRIAAPLENTLFVRGYWDEALSIVAVALEAARSSGVQTEIITWLINGSEMYRSRGQLDTARQLIGESVEISKKTGDQTDIALSLYELAIIEHFEGHIEEALRLYSETLQIAQKLGNQRGIASSLGQLGTLAYDRGDLDEAQRLYTETLEIGKQLGEQEVIAAALQHLGAVLRNRQELTQARELLTESVEISRKLGDQLSIASSLHELAMLAEGEGGYAEAAQLFSEAFAIFEKLKSPSAETARRNLERVKGKSD